MTSVAPEVRFRRATEADLPACAVLWREGINDYQARLNLPLIPDEPGSAERLGRLHAHALATDPDGFVVATRDASDDLAPGPASPDRIVAFGSAVVRERVWFLSMLFVDPAAQSRGLGRAVLERILPAADDGMTLATATDSAQPISNALYASYGIAPRQPLWNLVGEAGATGLPPLPSGIAAVQFAEVADGGGAGEGHRRLVAAVDGLDRDALGYAHPQDHRYLRTTESRGYLYLGPDGAALGYGYTSPVGRIGPIATRDRALLAPVVGHLLGAVAARGGQGCWIPGDADETMVGLLRAGFRIEGFPVLLCWTRPFADLARYVPYSPGLL